MSAVGGDGGGPLRISRGAPRGGRTAAIADAF